MLSWTLLGKMQGDRLEYAGAAFFALAGEAREDGFGRNLLCEFAISQDQGYCVTLQSEKSRPSSGLNALLDKMEDHSWLVMLLQTHS